jgi:hypothetical protein
LSIVLGEPEVKRKLAVLGTYSRPMSPEETAAFIRSEQDLWRPVVKQLDLAVKAQKSVLAATTVQAEMLEARMMNGEAIDIAQQSARLSTPLQSESFVALIQERRS